MEQENINNELSPNNEGQAPIVPESETTTEPLITANDNLQVNTVKEESTKKSSEMLSQKIIEVPKQSTKRYRFRLNNKSFDSCPIPNDLTPDLLSNEICTSKYTVLTAIPKILFEQFSHIGNIYFLVLAILQIFPDFSQSGGSPIMLIPLIMVVSINGIKDFVEDYERKRSDQRENEAKTNIIYSNGVHEVQWREIKPGDLIKVNKNEYFPADLLLVYSPNKNGATFVETKNLDGETNLKYKECVKDLYSLYNIENKATEDNKLVDISTCIDAYVDCHEPFANLYEFDGILYKFDKLIEKEGIEPKSFAIDRSKLSLDESRDDVKSVKFRKTKANDDLDKEMKSGLIYNPKLNKKYNPIPIDSNNLLLRGSSLKNTDYVIGIVVYAGHHSKIMLNSLNARSKESTVTKNMNKALFVVVCVQFLICLIYSIVEYFIYNNYKPMKEIKRANILFNFFCWILALSNMVPISLLVTMEMIRFCQAYFMGYDYKMYDHANKRFVVIQSSGLNEELGQIHYIFTDKTGTLTKNVMQFKAMVIGNQTYGTDNHADPEELKAKGITNCDFNDENFNEQMHSGDFNTRKGIENYLFALALCHTIITEEDLQNPGKVIYNASSPDELALVNAAKFFGVELIERNADSVLKVKYNDDLLKYQLLHVFEFNSDRKRMSVLLKNLQDNTYSIITKGADSSISPRINENSADNLNYTIEQLANFGRKGLRTLLVASKNIKEEEYQKFMVDYKDAIVIEDPKEKDARINEIYNQIENDFSLLGATAIEDCLQDNLPETLSSFTELGIKIFMLTGDHPLTAISIAHSSGLITDEIVPIVVDSKKYTEINNALVECVDTSKKQETCLVITGNTLLEIANHLDKKDGLTVVFKLALSQTQCVICSRVSPKQKADIVKLVKEIDPKKTTLAIGDGANDVNMINVADVGIGIYGNEGQQAARASDYAIGQFYYLKRLLYIYGREAYRKNSFAVCYVLWKNFLYCTPIILFGLFSRFSAQLFYDPFMDSFYNIFFTALPVGWYAITDKEVNYDYLFTNPWKYRRGMKNKFFTPYIIFRWYCYAFFAGGLIFVVHYNVMCYTFLKYNDNGYDLWTTGASIMTCIIVVVNCKLIFETHTHTIYTAILIFFSIGSFIIMFVLGNYAFKDWKVYSVLPMLTTSIDFWMMLFLTILSYLVIEYGWRAVQFYFLRAKEKARKIKQKIREMKRQRKEKKRLKRLKLVPDISESDLSSSDLNDKGYAIMLHDKAYTGFAFSEDVANIDIINDNIRKNNEKESTTEGRTTDERNRNIIEDYAN